MADRQTHILNTKLRLKLFIKAKRKCLLFQVIYCGFRLAAKINVFVIITFGVLVIKVFVYASCLY